MGSRTGGDAEEAILEDEGVVLAVLEVAAGLEAGDGVDLEAEVAGLEAVDVVAAAALGAVLAGYCLVLENEPTLRVEALDERPSWRDAMRKQVGVRDAMI